MTLSLAFILGYACIAIYLFAKFAFIWKLEDIDQRLSELLEGNFRRIIFSLVIGVLWLPFFLITIVLMIRSYVKDKW